MTSAMKYSFYLGFDFFFKMKLYRDKFNNIQCQNFFYYVKNELNRKIILLGTVI